MKWQIWLLILIIITAMGENIERNIFTEDDKNTQLV